MSTRRVRVRQVFIKIEQGGMLTLELQKAQTIAKILEVLGFDRRVKCWTLNNERVSGSEKPKDGDFLRIL